eukprot:2563337-Lingulodinium_polyedra.AAC.1
MLAKQTTGARNAITLLPRPHAPKAAPCMRVDEGRNNGEETPMRLPIRNAHALMGSTPTHAP